MLKAVVGSPDSSGIVNVAVQSGPTIPDFFSAPASTHQAYTPDFQNTKKSTVVINSNNASLGYYDKIALENAQYDAYMAKSDTLARKVAEFRQKRAEFVAQMDHKSKHVHKTPCKVSTCIDSGILPCI